MAEKQTPTNGQKGYDPRDPGEAARRLMRAQNPGIFTRLNELRKEHPTATNLSIAAGLLIGSIPVIHAEFTQPTPAQQAATEQGIQQDHETEAYKDSIEQAVNAFYDKDAVIGKSFEIPQSGGLLDPALKEVVAVIGQDAYNEDQSDIYDSLYNSSLLHNVQPGETYAVVQTQPGAENTSGIEYVTVDISHILADPNEPIPSPKTH